jgi:hypothetical protein
VVFSSSAAFACSRDILYIIEKTARKGLVFAKNKKSKKNKKNLKNLKKTLDIIFRKWYYVKAVAR